MGQGTLLKRSEPLRRKTPMSRSGNGIKRSHWVRTKAPKNHEHYEHRARSTLQRNKGLKTCSKKHLRQKGAYYAVHDGYLAQEENRWCVVCICRSLHLPLSEVREALALPKAEGDALLRTAGATLTPSSEVHHTRGRIGRLLCYTPAFAPSCRACREWPHEMTREARALELLAHPRDWNVFPE